jgi:hypothetical protein
VYAYRVKTNLVHDSDSGLLALLIELHHGGGDVGCGDDIGLGADGGLNDLGVECVGDQGDGDIGLLEGLVKGSIVVDIQSNGLGVLEARGELLSALKGTASYLRRGQ